MRLQWRYSILTSNYLTHSNPTQGWCSELGQSARHYERVVLSQDILYYNYVGCVDNLMVVKRAIFPILLRA